LAGGDGGWLPHTSPPHHPTPSPPTPFLFLPVLTRPTHPPHTIRHWKEIDAMEWSRARLGELVAGLALVEGGGLALRVDKLESLKGESFINNRECMFCVGGSEGAGINNREFGGGEWEGWGWGASSSSVRAC
jgi:hypothetical protein